MEENMTDKIVISLYDYTGEALKPWAEAGYTCHAFDIQHDEAGWVDRFDGGGSIRYHKSDLHNIGNLDAIYDAFEGKQVTLHIYEPHEDKDSLLANPAEKTRFHIVDCKTLEQKRNNKTFDRYVISFKADGYFPLRPKEFETGNWGDELSVTLQPCHHCLSHLNYQNYADEGRQIRKEIKRNFSVKDFFSENKSVFRDLPVHKSVDAEECPYTEDWPEISRRFRESKNWSCECCGCNASDRRELLHTHHIDGNKKNNRNANLRALCILCHQKQPHHSRMSVKAEERLNVQKMRHSQDLSRKCLLCGS